MAFHGVAATGLGVYGCDLADYCGDWFSGVGLCVDSVEMDGASEVGCEGGVGGYGSLDGGRGGVVGELGWEAGDAGGEDGEGKEGARRC